MRRVFRILSSKLDRKLNHPRRARTILRSKVNVIYGTIIRRVYGEYTITSCFLGNFSACANIRYQAAFPPPPLRPGYEASGTVWGNSHGDITLCVHNLNGLSWFSKVSTINYISRTKDLYEFIFIHKVTVQ